LVAVFGHFFLCPVRYLSDGGTDQREILHDGTIHIGLRQVSPLLEPVPPGIPIISNFWHKFQLFDRQNLENGKSQR